VAFEDQARGVWRSDVPHGGSASPEGGTSSCGQHGERYGLMSGVGAMRNALQPGSW
jgi:hypothetical protein